MQNYIDQIQNLDKPTFQKIRNIADNSISYLSKEDRNKLWRRLNHGVDLLDSHEFMCQYLFSFGNMHEAKLKDAVKNLPIEAFHNDFEIVDWGCGQGIASICFFDHLKNQNIVNNVKKITLIEPSKDALNRAKLHIASYVKKNTEINTFQKYLDDISIDDVKSKNNFPVIHFFSNILDIPQIDLKLLATKIDKTVFQDNYIVSVGPLNQGNKRIDAFYNYYNVPTIYDEEYSQFDYGGYSTCTYKVKVYKLEFNEQGNLIPIEFYPAVQFSAGYQLDCVTNKLKELEKDEQKKSQNLYKIPNTYETSTPFDIGASVYDDIHPILAVLNNIITRGLPTKVSVFIEETFLTVFGFSKYEIKYGGIDFVKKLDIEFYKILKWYSKILKTKILPDYSLINTNELQLVFSPIAIARIQKTVLEALMTDKLDINKRKWKILIEEKDVPCSAIAFADLDQMFNNLTKLSKDYQNLVFPDIDLTIISNDTFFNSKLHLNSSVLQKPNSEHLKTEYDLVIDISIFQTSNIKKDSFSKFKCLNNCYFNIRSSASVRSERNIYTSDRIQYRDLVSTNAQGNYKEIQETKELLEYFLQLIFRKESFRAGQLPILNRALQNKSVIGLLPTGGGKSLTYQLAAMLQPGVTLIVDPLKSLMKDQYDGLINVGIDTCAYINSTLSEEEKNEAERKMEESKLQFVFLTPERLVIYKFREKLKNMHELNVYFSYGVIDEVHCVSEWGHDFRTSYLHLGRNLYNYVRAKKGEFSLFGLTATASFDVLADVERELSGNGAFPLDSETIVRYENANRVELQYKIEKVNVEFVEDKFFDKKGYIDSSLPKPVNLPTDAQYKEAKSDFLTSYIKKVPDYLNELQDENSVIKITSRFEERQNIEKIIEQNLIIETSNYFKKHNQIYNEAGIIFCPHRGDNPKKKPTGISVIGNYNSLNNNYSDVVTFLGGDNEDNKSMKNLELFRDNKKLIMVATKAFGMGIDKPNVRFTVNMNYSSSLESFVQEAGRAGRDKKIALSTILLSDYRLARISNNYSNKTFPSYMIKGRWYRPDDLRKVIAFYKLDVDDKEIDYLTPQDDIVKFSCNKKNEDDKYIFYKDLCSKDNCNEFNKCDLRKVSKEYRYFNSWYYIKDIEQYIVENNYNIDKKYFKYHNTDYDTVIYFFDKSFKGEVIEKQAMFQILNLKNVDVFYGDDAEIKANEISTVKGFLTTLLNAEVGQEIITFINYKTQNTINGIYVDETDIAKAIYRMTCIGLIEDFTQDNAKKRYRIVSKRKREGDYYIGLERFLLRYYSIDRAKEEIKNVYNIDVKSSSELEKEIFQCLSYLTTFVYDKISVKRKRAIDDMRTFCITGANDTKDWKDTNEELKDFIYYYFNSKYAKNDYIADNGEDYSITVDTDDGKKSEEWILFKYLKIIDDKVEQGTPIDNVKHLQGAVRLLRRSLTDSNPTLSLLNSFCIFFLGTNNNENLKKEVIESYTEGMLGFAEREKELVDFWGIFENYNLILKPFSDMKLEELKDEIKLKIHHNKFKNITSKYIG